MLDTKIIDEAMKAIETIGTVSRGIKYGFVEKTAPITYMGKKGLLVWDYLIWNELTFEEAETGKMWSLVTDIRDKRVSDMFDAMVEKYGDETVK